jgi:uncharacterized membrane protein YfcA
MIGHLIAAGHTTSAGTLGFSGGTWFLAIVASVLGAQFRWAIPVGFVLLYLAVHSGAAAFHTGDGTLPWVVIAVIGGFVGWQVGGRAILRHVGEREYRTRMTAARGVSSIWRNWFPDPR